MHISSLLIILIFGLILNNRHFFFRKRLEKLISNTGIERLLADFKLFTAETAFLVRTFFFVFFGMSLSFETLAGGDVWIVSVLVIVALFGIRFLLFSGISKKNKYPEVWIAPRGLISILLFYAIPKEFIVRDFESGALFVVILITSLVMAFGLMLYNRKKGNSEGLIISKEK